MREMAHSTELKTNPSLVETVAAVEDADGDSHPADAESPCSSRNNACHGPEMIVRLGGKV